MDFLLTLKGFSLFMEVFIKSTVICGLGLFFIFLFRKQAAAFRHWILVATVVGLLLLPLTMVFAPGWNTGIPALNTQFSHPNTTKTLLTHDLYTVNTTHEKIPQARPWVSPATPETETQQTHLWQWLPNNTSYALIALWFLGIGMGLFFLCLGVYGALRFIRHSVPLLGYPWQELIMFFLSLAPIPRKVRLLQSSACAVPMTCGIVSPVVIVPNNADEWPVEQCSSVLFHELAHIKRWDFLVRLMTRFICILYWFNPLCWEVYRNLKREQEKACDEMVLKMGVKPSLYATHLLELRRTLENRPVSPSLGLGMADKSEFKERLIHILKKQINKKEVKVKTKVFIMMVGMLLILVIGTAKAVPVWPGNPGTEKKAAKSKVDLEKTFQQIEAMKEQLEKAFEEQKLALAKLGDKEQLEKSEILQADLEKALEQMDAAATDIEKVIESGDIEEGQVAEKLEEQLKKLAEMEQILEKKGEELEALADIIYDKQDILEKERVTKFEEESQLLEKEAKKLEEEAKKLELESQELEKEAQLLEAKQEQTISEEEQKKLEEDARRLEKLAQENDRQAAKMEKAAQLLEEKNRALDEKMENIEPEENSDSTDDKLDKEYQTFLADDQKNLKLKNSSMLSTFIAKGTFTDAQTERFQQAVSNDKTSLPADLETVLVTKENMLRLSIYYSAKDTQPNPEWLTKIKTLFKKYATILEQPKGKPETDFIVIFNK